MRVAITTVGSRELKGENEKEIRINAGNIALEKTKHSLNCDVIVLPAGFLVSKCSKSRQEMADSFIDEAQLLELAVIFGVDDMDKDPNIGGSCGYAWSPTEIKFIAGNSGQLQEWIGEQSR